MSKKDAYYFPHFSNGRNDRKIKRLRKDLKNEGYAIYFMLLEVLRDQDDFKYPIKDVDLLADEFETSEAIVRTIIGNYDLFEIVDDYFFSPKQIEYMQPYIQKVERARNAANIKWGNANAMQMHSDGTAVAMQGEERRGEKKREENKKREDFPVNTKSTLKAIEECKKVCEADQINYLENAMRLTGLKKESIFKALQLFNSYLSASGEYVKSLKDYRQHSLNWMNKQDKTKFKPDSKPGGNLSNYGL